MANIDELIATLAEDAVAVKPAPHPLMLSLRWMAGVSVYLAVSLVIFGLRPDSAIQLHRTLFVAEIAALGCILFATSLSAALLAFPDLHQLRRLVYVPLAAFASLVLVMFFAWQADSPPAPLPVHSIECTISIALFSLLPAAWILFGLRKFASTHYHWAGSVALLFAFSVGALWLRLFEATDSIAHVIEWHYLPMLVTGTVGLWLGKKILKW
jgi:hypothetical protein